MAGKFDREYFGLLSLRCRSLQLAFLSPIPHDAPRLRHLIISRRDAPLDGGLRDRSYFDVGDRFRVRAGCETDTVMLVRPDDHIAAIAPMREASIAELYRSAARIRVDCRST